MEDKPKLPSVEIECVTIDFPKPNQEQLDYVNKILNDYLKVKENGVSRN